MADDIPPQPRPGMVWDADASRWTVPLGNHIPSVYAWGGGGGGGSFANTVHYGHSPSVSYHIGPKPAPTPMRQAASPVPEPAESPWAKARREWLRDGTMDKLAALDAVPASALTPADFALADEPWAAPVPVPVAVRKRSFPQRESLRSLGVSFWLCAAAMASIAGTAIGVIVAGVMVLLGAK